MSQNSDSDTAVKEATEGPQIEVSPEGGGELTAVEKVELDVEDAPFLQKEQEAAEQLPATTGSEEVQADEDVSKKKKKKKKLLIIGGAVVLLLVVAGVAAWWFTRAPEVPPPPPPEEPKPEVIVVPSVPQVVVKPDIIREFDLFIVPTGSEYTKAQFLICKFATISKIPTTNNEIDQKKLVLRDAVYYYLRGKPAEYLLDSANAASIKKDLVEILNGYLTRGKLEDVLLDSYLGH